MKKLTTYLATLLVLTCHSLAQETDPFVEDDKQANTATKKLVKKDAKQIRVYFETIEISSLQLAELVNDSANAGDDAKLRQALLQQCKDGKAKLLNNHLLTTDEDQTALLESIKEFIYPTEYEPPHIGEATKVDKTAKAEKKEIIPPHPTAFETRNIGFTIEVTASILTEKNKIKLLFKPEYVNFIGFSNYGNYLKTDNKVEIVMPEFYTKRSHLSLTLANNKFLLISTHQAGKADNQNSTKKQLTFIRATILN